MSVNFTPFDVKWVPCSAKFLVGGCRAPETHARPLGTNGRVGGNDASQQGGLSGGGDDPRGAQGGLRQGAQPRHQGGSVCTSSCLFLACFGWDRHAHEALGRGMGPKQVQKELTCILPSTVLQLRRLESRRETGGVRRLLRRVEHLGY
eukprot:scaffold8507_cov277-Pinguiococcus_pyrenoidosus.AAC.4